MKKTFIFTGNGSCMNHGCEAIIRSTVKLLEEEFPGSSYINSPEKQGRTPDSKIFNHPQLVHKPFNWPKKTRLDRKIRSIKSRLGILKTYPYERELKNASCVLALGGDNYTLDYGPNLPKRQFDAARYAHRHGKPFVIWGASIGPFSEDPEFEKYATDELGSIDILMVREQVTVDYLASLGVSDNVVRVADPAFHLDSVKPPKIDEDAYFLNQEPIGLNLSPLLGAYLSKEKWQALAKEMLIELDKVSDRPILLIPHVNWEISDDHAFLADILSGTSGLKNPVKLLPDLYNAVELKWVISKLSLLCAARTHATIAAFSQCVPTVSIGYSKKSVGINQDLFGSQEWVVDSNTMTASSFALKVKEALASTTEIRQKLQETIPDYKFKSKRAVLELKKLIG